MKEKILNGCMLFLLLFMMVQGFFFTYAIIWYCIGLPLTTWSFWLLYTLSGITEYGYYRWLIRR